MSGKDMALAFDYQKIDQAYLDDPFPTYASLREHDPVHQNPDGTYFLTRYEDVVLAMRHPAMSSDKTVDLNRVLAMDPCIRITPLRWFLMMILIIPEFGN